MLASALPVLVVLSPLAGQAEGFGGRATAAPAPSKAEADKSEPKRQKASTQKASTQNARTQEPKKAPLIAPQDPVRVTSEEPDWDAPEKPSKDPLRRAFQRMRQNDPKGPLTELRAEVEKLGRRAEWAAKEVKAGRRPESLADEANAQLAAERGILVDVEVIALRLRQRCAREHRVLEELPKVLVPVGTRLELGRYDVKALVDHPDPMKCQRVALVDEGVINRMRRLHAIEQRLASEELGYFQIDTRRKLEKERDGLLAEVKGLEGLKPLEDLSKVQKPFEPLSKKPMPGLESFYEDRPSTSSNEPARGPASRR